MYTLASDCVQHLYLIQKCIIKNLYEKVEIMTSSVGVDVLLSAWRPAGVCAEESFEDEKLQVS